MSSSEVLEGTISQVTDIKEFTYKDGNLGRVQNIVINNYKVAIWNHKEDFKPYSGKTVRILNLKSLTDGSYKGNYLTEIDDRVDSDVGYTEDDRNKDMTDVFTHMKKNATPLEDNISPPTSSELSKYSITVTRSKDYQSIALSEEFTGSFKEIEGYWTELNEMARSLLLRMPKL